LNLKLSAYRHFFFGALLIFLCAYTGSAQKKTKIKLIQADQLVGDQSSGDDLNIFVGNVIFEHDSAFLYCDSAVYNSRRNNLDAFGNVHILLSDTLSLYGDVLNYSGNTRIVTVTGNVKLVDNDATLITDRMVYKRTTKIAYYTTGGKIISEENELVSERGYYYTLLKEVYFKNDVFLTNPDYIVKSDSLMYNTSTEIAYISGPTTIWGDDEFLYAEDGWYDTRNDRSKLTRNSYMTYKEQYLAGDTIFYDKLNDAGAAYGNILIRDTVKNIIVTGNFADYRRAGGYAFATDSAVAVLIDKRDSLFLHADTLRIAFDSLQEPEKLLAFYKSKFFKKDLQGMCDSLVYNFRDSTITMYNKPALWTQDNQLTAEVITIYSSGQKVDSMHLVNSAFIISIDKYNPDKFNQIKGKNMTGYFKDNELYKIAVDGNSETIYFVREEDGSMIGINKAASSNMEIRISKRQIKDIVYRDQPDATLYNEKEFPVQELLLRDFKWLGSNRPEKKNDIFIWDIGDKPLK